MPAKRRTPLAIPAAPARQEVTTFAVLAPPAKVRRCRKVLPDRTICRQPVEYLTAEQSGSYSGLYHLDRSLTADHHAVSGGY